MAHFYCKKLAVIASLTVVAFLGSCGGDGGDASKQPETSPPSPEMIERLVQTALDYEGLQEYYYPGLPGRDTLAISGWDLPEGMNLVKHGNPVMFIDTCTNERNCIEVERLKWTGDSAYIVLWYPIQGLYCELSYKVDHERFILLSHDLMEL